MAVKQKVVKLSSCFVDGVIATYSDIEISLSPGIPTFDIIGLCDSSIRESRGRITSAVRSLGHLMPKGHITVNISPAYMHKSGSGFDLPIALGILMLAGIIDYDSSRTVYAQGELSLNGDVKGTPGSILKLMEAVKHSNDIVLIPREEMTAAGCSGIACMCVDSLRDASLILEEDSYKAEVHELNPDGYQFRRERHQKSLGYLKGQPKAETAITIACAGMHSLLMLGSPGCGKSFAAEIIARLMPCADEYEISQYLALQEVADISAGYGLYSGRPFRRISSNCTSSQLTGKPGSYIPGELALANNGVLFADEICEFSPKIIDELKGPLEEHVVRMNKDGKVITVPASFLFVATGNPCRCGMYYEGAGKCKCTPAMRKNYLKKLSGSFLDRIDLFTEMRSVGQQDLKEMTDGYIEDDYSEICSEDKIRIAWAMQRERYGWRPGEPKRFNGTCENISGECFDYDSTVSGFASEAAKRAGLSGRGFAKLMRVARTIADMEGSVKMNVDHVKRALMFKVKEDVI